MQLEQGLRYHPARHNAHGERMQMRQVLIIMSLLASTLAGCTGKHIPFVYRIDIPQGNVITQEMVDQLQKGMDRQRVAYVMGTSLLVDVFHQDRWDYVYRLKPGRGKPTERRISLYFENDQLVRITGHVVPGAAEPPVESRQPGPGPSEAEAERERRLEDMTEPMEGGDVPFP